MNRTTVEALKDFGLKLTGKEPTGETIVEVIDSITENYTPNDSTSEASN